MMFAIVGTLIVAVVLIAALLFKMSSHAIRTLEASHERTTEYTKDLIDRLMAMDYGTYKAYQHMEEVRDELTSSEPEEPRVPTLGPDRGGFGSRLGLRALTVRANGAEEVEALMESEIPT